MFALILALGQGVMYSLGGLLGGTFMHLVAKHSQWIVLALCFSIALGINAFIAGLMSEFLTIFQNLTPYIIMGISFIWAMTAMMILFSKMKLTFNSLLNIILAAVIFARGLLFLI